ncbi:uncharacterized protein I303_106339 [Kwoniella dejecticola CBS 10117]|uniref:Transcription factor domain-containing protein n=1 Tax=Kwoniella dejecticola CBS 10117 TaxID=1296121 RepID=A0A1A5ZV05_9TREE|nr:uncharacterized protein I303_08404 [Kwoniella dejecticola CBS 10117]OBR81633.1 hypothetical protein I303_08404 [Kwoniella dejecticola CBS 10117]
MDGHAPTTSTNSQSAPATSYEVDALKQRMEQLERHIVRLVDIVDTAHTSNGSTHKSSPRSHSAYPTPYSGHTAPTPSAGPSKSTTIDKAFLALDDLSRGYVDTPNSASREEPAKRPLTGSDIPRPVDIWPSIFTVNDSQLPDPKTSRLIYDIAAALPNDQTVTILIDHHLSNDGIFWHFIQENVLKAELLQFSQVRYGPSLILVDPAWLTLLIAILRVSIQSLLSEGDLAVILLVGDKVTLESMDAMLADAFESAMHASKFLHKPQVRILQALLISMSPQQLGCFLDCKTERGVLWHDVAISLCTHLGLAHIDDSVADNDLPQDPAFPPSAPLYTREWSARFSHSLLFMDEVIAAIETDRRGSSSTRAIRLSAEHVSTPSPRNFRDEDLWREGVDVIPRVEPCPSFVLTETSWQIHGLRAAYFWKIISGLIRDPSTMTPEIIRSIDSEIRLGDYELLSLRNSHQLNRVQDILLESFHGSYQQRCLRLHRRYFLQSYSDSAYDFSQSAALSAARSIIKGHKDVVRKYDTFSPRFLTLVFFSHHISATVLLFIHGCLRPSDRHGVQGELQSSLSLFVDAKPPNSVKDRQAWTLSVGRGKLFVEAMLQALTGHPPADLPSIENYLLELNNRCVEPPPANVDSVADYDDFQQVPLSSLLGLFDHSTSGYVQNGDVSEQNPAQLDWDSMFMGF